MSRKPHESEIVKWNRLFRASVGRVKDMPPSPAVSVHVQEVMPWHDYNSKIINSEDTSHLPGVRGDYVVVLVKYFMCKKRWLRCLQPCCQYWGSNSEFRGCRRQLDDDEQRADILSSHVKVHSCSGRWQAWVCFHSTPLSQITLSFRSRTQPPTCVLVSVYASDI